jgi:glutaminase
MSRYSSGQIRAAIGHAYSAPAPIGQARNADYIPALADVSPDLFGIAVATADGRILEIGDSRHLFAIESISKLFTMARVIEQLGPDEFHERVGADPTGMPFNSILALELHNDLPMSPLVNAGAITTVSLLQAGQPDDRWQQILDTQTRFAGRPIAMSEQVNASEQQTNAHNKAIAWLLASAGILGCDPMEACDLYTRQCSTLVDAADLAVMGATLANNGTNPLTHETVLTPENVPHLLAEMTMEGLYTQSGDWAYRVGLPAKSGVGGGLLAVAPGELAIAAFSPPLDPAGNSVRAKTAVARVARELRCNLYAPDRSAWNDSPVEHAAQ